MKHYTPIVTDDPQDNVEAALNLVFVKNSEVYVRGYGPAPDLMMHGCMTWRETCCGSTALKRWKTLI